MLFDHALVYNDEKALLMAVLLAGVVLTSALAACIYSVNLHRRQKHTLLAMHAVILIIQAGQFLAVVSPPRELPFLVKAQVVGLCLLGPLFFLCVRASLNGRHLVRRGHAALFLFPAACILLLVLGDYRGFFHVMESGLHVAYAPGIHLVAAHNGLCGLAALYLLVANRKRHGSPCTRTILAAAGAVCLVAAVDLFEYVHPQSPAYDMTPASLTIAQLFFYLASPLFKRSRSLLSTRTHVLDSLNEVVLLTDRWDNVVYSNNASLGASLRDRLPTEPGGACLQVSTLGEIAVQNGEQRHYSFCVRPILVRGKDRVGMLYTFRDITEYKALIAQLNAKNEALLSAQRTLREHARLTRQLAEEEERNKILREVGRTVGQHIDAITRNLEAARLLADDRDGRFRSALREAVERARRGIEEIRSSVRTLASSAGTEGGIARDQAIDS